ncbi:hypothetical protein C1645_828932 [Glomus cerebriforme]|uniref:RBR-type E3 ubiquitin transferase n=1 Tax=Glomus cerebriforme TaxID=658196 RepID=A0A397SLX1_9GLOM|nr:hypothetical protein C1645_828932 [Glomus cerebriforme]
MYSYTTTSTSHPSYKKENSSSPYTYTTTSSSSLNSNGKYHFTVTSDYMKRKKYKNVKENDDDDTDDDDDDDDNENEIDTLPSSSTSSSTSQTRDCMICVETLSVNQFEKITKNCSHPNDICKGCVAQHVETQLNTKGDVEGILCPFGNDCGFLIEHDDVQRIVNNDLFERYDGLALKQALSNMPDFRWCKNAGCGSGQIHSGGDKEPIMTCKACGEKSCYTHDIPWHDALTCEQYNEAKKGEDVATQDLLDRETKKCPKCGVRITKNGGCNHMTCRVQNCRHEFCWLCLADFNQIRRHGNHYHERTCQLYA